MNTPPTTPAAPVRAKIRVPILYVGGPFSGMTAMTPIIMRHRLLRWPTGGASVYERRSDSLEYHWLLDLTPDELAVFMQYGRGGGR